MSQNSSKLTGWFVQEPRLIFGEGNTHVDQKAGLTRFGPCMLTDPNLRLPFSIRIGIIGTGETISLAQRWLAKCKDGVTGSADQPNLRPFFPGYEKVFGCEL